MNTVEKMTNAIDNATLSICRYINTVNKDEIVSEADNEIKRILTDLILEGEGIKNES